MIKKSFFRNRNERSGKQIDWTLCTFVLVYTRFFFFFFSFFFSFFFIKNFKISSTQRGVTIDVITYSRSLYIRSLAFREITFSRIYRGLFIKPYSSIKLRLKNRWIESKIYLIVARRGKLNESAIHRRLEHSCMEVKEEKEEEEKFLKGTSYNATS